MIVFNTREAAAYVKLGKNTLERFRCAGTGPAYLKLGGSVRYRQIDLDAWLTESLVGSTPEVAAE